MSEQAKPERKYFGSAGHLIVSEFCRFHIATQIGDVFVSTVGDYYTSSAATKPRTVGYNRLFETMVFVVKGPCGCGCGMPEHDGREIDFAGYNTRSDANAGHEAMCVKWAHGIAPAREADPFDDDESPAAVSLSDDRRTGEQ